MTTVFLFIISCLGSNIVASADEVEESDFEHIGCNCVITYDTYEYPENTIYIDSAATVPAMFSENPLPESVDNSTSLCFPVVKSQGALGSCAFFSAAYYQFTYQKNRLNNTYARTSDGQEIPENVASPAYPYNVKNYGETLEGAYAVSVHNFMQMFGCVSLADLPYNDTNTTALPTTQAMIDALKTRVSDYNAVVVDTEVDQIDNADSALLSPVKSMLNNGYLLNVSVNLDGYHSKPTTRNNVQEMIIYGKTANSTPNHTMTVVGYDDTIWCDINGDGEAQDAEYGALKLVNSWSSNWANDGFVWLAYDALNYESAVPGWNCPDDRGVFFCANNKFENVFTYIEVENYDVNYIFKLDYDVSCMQRGIALKRMNVDGTGLQQIDYVVSSMYSNREMAIPVTMVFDYSTLCDPIGSYLSDYKWSFNVWKPQSCVINNAYMVDDDDNIISTFDVALDESGLYYTGETELDLQYSDMNYDGIIDADDVQFLYSAVSGLGEWSTLQEVLADYNRDGEVNMLDVRAMYRQVGGGLNAMQLTVMQTQCILLLETI